ncbi:SpaA isopeptide-forming pilin-related protein [Alkalicoccobacillus gibsonii]|uniref:SpaA isopeptide-forming pilin-related protein n=1 Tax=Alkalicoccobacillus gibsonii TaxID=79881 RepID=UPI003F7C16B1
MKKNSLIVLMILMMIFQPTLASSGIAIAETLDKRDLVEIDLLKNDEALLQGQKLNKQDPFITKIAFKLGANLEEQEIPIDVPKEIVFTEPGGVIVSQTGTEVGTYKRFDETLVLNINELEDEVEATLLLSSTWNQDEIDSLDSINITFITNSTEKLFEILFEVEEENSLEQEVNGSPESSNEEVQEGTEEESLETTDQELNADDEFQLNQDQIEKENEANKEEIDEDINVNSPTEEESIDEENFDDDNDIMQSFAINAMASEIELNIITDVRLTNEAGDPIDRTTNPNYKPTLGSAANVYLDWVLPNNHGYTSGSTFSFTLPEEFQLYNEVDGILDFDGDTVGTFTMDINKNVIMTFNENIETLSNIQGMLFFETIINEQLQGDVEREIIFNVKGEDIAKIPVIFAAPNGSEIDKQGSTNRSYNATTVNWSVDFNKQMKILDQAVFNDQLQENLVLKTDTVKVFKLNIYLDGTVHLGDEIDSSQYTIKQDPFEIDFGDISSAYRVVYETDITDDEGTTYRNNVQIESSNQATLSAGASVTTSRGQALEKRSIGYDPSTQTITWEIRYNYNQKTISQTDAFLFDKFSNTHGLVEDSLKVEEVSINEAGEGSVIGEVSNYTTSNEENGFNLQFNEQIDQAYLITYETKSIGRVIADETVIIENTVTSNTDSKTATRGTTQQILSKGYSGLNYQTKKVNWTIDINRDSYEMNNVIVDDSFVNKGLAMDEDSFVVRNQGNGSILAKDVDYILSNNGADGYQLIFNNTINEPHRITYTTEFEFDELEGARFTNRAGLSWINENGDPLTKTATAGFEPDAYTKNNGFKNGSYNAVTKEITWNIGVNYDLKNLNDIKITDFIKGNQNLLEDSIVVYEANLTGGSNGATKGDILTEGEDYALTLTTNSENEPGFVVDLAGNRDQAYWVEYKTSLKDELISDRYDNTATLESTDRNPVDLNAHVGISNGGSYVNKTGRQNGKVIDWNININFTQSTVSNAIIKDEQQNNQILVENSFKLYATNVAENGVVSKADLLNADEDYKLNIETAADGSQTFELKFDEQITTAYILEYQSFINADNNEYVSNKASFLGEEITDNESTESNQSFQVRVSSGGGTGSGQRGSLTVTKIDADTDETLEGARFTLYDSEGEIAIRSLITGQDGVVTFNNLRYNDYILKEENAPEGYVVGIQDQRAFTIAGDEEVTIENKKITRHVELTKVDTDTGEVVDGAVFSLERQEDSDWLTIATDLKTVGGVLLYEDLEAGNYRFIETQAPDFYLLDEDPIAFVITEQQTEITKVEKTNEIIKGAVSLTKVDSIDRNPLEGATFKLTNEDGQTIQESITTTEAGLLEIKNLRPGNYQLTETQAPEFYRIDPNPISFEIEPGSNATVQIGEVENTLITGNINLTKIDSEDNTRLEGAVFSLLDDEEVPVHEGLTTNSLGFLEVTGLAPGTYYLKETEAPKDYQLNDELFEVIITPSNQTEVQWNEEVSNTLVTGSVSLRKIDDRAGTLLEGGIFSLFNSNDEELYTDLVTNELGEIEINDLKPGDYYFVETSAPEHYLLDNVTKHPFTIVRGQIETAEIEVKNTLKPGTVSLLKVDEDDETITLANAEFTLEDEDGNEIATDLVTDSNGRVIVEDLAPGTYYFIETQAPEHYELDSTRHEVVVEKSQEQPVLIEIKNQLIKGSVVLEKVDDVTGESLSGAEFRLETVDGEIIQENLTTGSDGRIVISDLKPGDYQFVETKAPIDYQINQQAVVFEINKSQETAKELLVENTLIPGSVQLTKVNLHRSTEKLEAAEFKVLNTDGETLLEGLTTDEEGVLVVESLAPGNYFFVETKAPIDYVLDGSPIPFEIERSQESTKLIQATNELIRGEVSLLKTDNDNNDTVLQGATFELRDINDTVIATEQTNEDGKLLFSDVLPGEYEVVEIKAPFGYILDRTPVKVTVERSQEEGAQLVKSNTLTPGSAVLVKTDSKDSSILLEGATFSLLNEKGTVLATDLKTDQDGQLKVDNLPPGDYQFVETDAPTYYVLDKTPIIFTIEKGQELNAQVTTTNTLQPGSVILTKLDEDNEDVTLSGAVFQLINEQGDTIKDNLISDDNGRVIVEDLTPGKYYFAETKAPDHYEVSDQRYEVIIEKGQTEPLFITATNSLIKGTVVLEKVDSVDEKHFIEGAEFRLETIDGEVLEELLITDGNGRIVVSDLKPGNYQFVETKAPANYDLDNSPVEFEIQESQEEAIVKSFENTLTPGSVTLTKTDSLDPTLVLEGAEFTLFNEIGEEIETGLVTDGNGQVKIDNLPPGQYQFVEVQAPIDYVLDETPSSFIIEKGQEATVEKVITNTLKKGSVVLTKVDLDNEDLILPGATFHLYDQNENILDLDLTTDDNGQINKELAPGSYVFVESKAPQGYELDSSPIVVDVPKGFTDVISVKVTNKEIEEPNNPETPSEPNPEEPGSPETPGEPSPEEPGSPETSGEQGPKEPGTPETSSEPNPEDLGNPSNQENTDDSKKGIISAPTNDSKVDSKQTIEASESNTGKLPQTGEEKYLIYLLVGTMLILIGAGLTIQSKRVRKVTGK